MDLEQIMERSKVLENQFYELLDVNLFDDSDRIMTSYTMCSIALEHSNSLRLLIEANNLTSGVSLIRLQYESIVRAIWLLYAASDIAVSKLSQELTLDSEQSANKLPSVSDMLIKINNKAPQQASQMLNEFKDVSWKAMNSFIHGGIHSINRHSKGYPLSLIIDVIKNSNGLSTMAGMMLAILSGDTRTTTRVSKIQRDFKDCLPILIGSVNDRR